MINSKHYLALTISLTIFIVSIFAFIFIYRLIGTQLDTTRAIYSEIAQTKAEENQAHSIVSELSTTKTNRDLLLSYFVRDDQTVDFIQKIESVGNKSGSNVSIVSISDDDLSSTTAGTTGSIRAHINIKGTWEETLRGLHLMENLPYGESVDNLRATPISKNSWNIEFDLTVALIHT